MNRDCKEALQLRLHFEHTLKEWGWFDAYERALELIPVGPPRARSTKKKQTTHIEARHAYVAHMAGCLVWSERLITTDALVTIREKLNTPKRQPIRLVN